MTIRDQLHDLIDDLGDEPAKPTLHVNIDQLPDGDLPEALERLETLRLLFEEQAEAFSVQRPHMSR